MRTFEVDLENCEKFIARYLDNGGNSFQLLEGTLLLGTILLEGDNLKTYIVEEYFINCWSSGLRLKEYRGALPQKYEKLREKYLQEY